MQRELWQYLLWDYLCNMKMALTYGTTVSVIDSPLAASARRRRILAGSARARQTAPGRAWRRSRPRESPTCPGPLLPSTHCEATTAACASSQKQVEKSSSRVRVCFGTGRGAPVHPTLEICRRQYTARILVGTHGNATEALEVFLLGFRALAKVVEQEGALVGRLGWQTARRNGCIRRHDGAAARTVRRRPRELQVRRGRRASDAGGPAPTSLSGLPSS